MRSGGGAGGGHGNGENRVCAEAGFGWGAVELDHGAVDAALVGGVQASDGFREFGVGVGDGFQHTFAEIFGFVGVAHLQGFVFAGGRTGRNRGAAACAPRYYTSASTVGFPRESMTWRAWTRVIFVDISICSPQ